MLISCDQLRPVRHCRLRLVHYPANPASALLCSCFAALLVVSVAAFNSDRLDFEYIIKMRQPVGREDGAELKDFIVVRTEGGNTEDVIKIPKQKAVCKCCWEDLVKEDGEAVDALKDSKVVDALKANCDCENDIIIHSKCFNDWSSKYGVNCPFCHQEAKHISVTLSLAYSSTESAGKTKKWLLWLKNYSKLLSERKRKETD